MRVHVTFALASVLAPALGCATSLETAKSAYDKGDYPAAKTALLAIERVELDKGGCARAEYELYRGLTHLGLGDKAAAKQWLAWSKGRNETVFREKLQTCFGKNDLARLNLALESAER